MDAIRLENLWRDQLDARGWSRAASNCLRLSLASSTLANYDRYIRDLFVFCDARGVPFPPRDTAAMADFFMHRCCSSARPHSTVRCVSAAVSALYEALGMDNPARDPFIVRLLQSIVKSGTRAPLAKSTVMDVSAFTRLFRSWPANEDLTIKQLRCKTIALLALALMLRPSDIAPLARRYEAGTDIVSDFVMSTDQFQFTEDGAVKVTFLGVKNDTQRTGFQVTLPSSPDPQLDPVRALRTYLSRTDSVRCRITKPAFLTLVRPFVAVSASTVSGILQEAISHAEKFGLGSGHRPKDFRPTGATRAVQLGFDADDVQRMGRWKTRSVFLEHYVHSEMDPSFTQALFK